MSAKAQEMLSVGKRYEIHDKDGKVLLYITVRKNDFVLALLGLAHKRGFTFKERKEESL